jgi:hypothetical protein
MNPDSGADAASPPEVTRLTDDENLAASLQKVAHGGRDLLPSCVSSSLTLIAARRPLTMAPTDAVAVALDEVQYGADDGPCLTAARLMAEPDTFGALNI